MGPSGDQLPLAIDDRPTAGVLPRLRQMQPTPADAPFDDADWFFEPWWPGATALAYLEQGRIHLQTEHLADADAAFPELGAIAGCFAADRLVVAGTLLVLDGDGRPDLELLRQRLAAHAASDGDPAFVAAEVLFADGQALVDRPFSERRARLAEILSDGDRCVISRGYRGEGTTLAEAVSSLGLGEISARRLAAPYRAGRVSEDWLRLPVVEAPTTPTRPLLTLLQRLPL
jgi:bifunctional non-homologous end joining protein LigD